MSTWLIVVMMIRALTAIPWLVWIFADLGKGFSVRGTRQRYVWASIEHATRWFAATFILTGVIMNLADGNMPMAAAHVFVLFVTAVSIARNVKDDDDDFWTDLGKRLKKRLKAMIPTPHFVPSPA